MFGFEEENKNCGPMRELDPNRIDQRNLGLGTWLSSGSPVVAELASVFNFDWLLFDLEHGCLTEHSLLHCMQTVKSKNTRIIVRVPRLDEKLIAKVLDWGAVGIMLPQVENPIEVEACLKAMRYPPNGSRGYSSSARSYDYGFKKPENPVELPSPIFIAQIENIRGVENAPAIAAIEGVDVLFIGPSDLKLAIASYVGVLSKGYDQILKDVIHVCIQHGKQAGILISETSDIVIIQNMGFSCIAVGSDLGILRNGYQEIIYKYHNGTKK